MISKCIHVTPISPKRGLCALYAAILSLASLVKDNLLSSFEDFQNHADKGFHFAAYSALVATLCWGLPLEKPNAYGSLAMIITICLCYGLILEGLQALLQTFSRDFSFSDIAANTAGSIAGAVTWRHYGGIRT